MKVSHSLCVCVQIYELKSQRLVWLVINKVYTSGYHHCTNTKLELGGTICILKRLYKSLFAKIPYSIFA